MKGIIIYKSKYGAAKQYAQWFGEGMGFEVVSLNDMKGKNVKEYDCFVVGSSIYMGRSKAAKWVRDNWEGIKDKKVFFFSVGDTNPDNEKEVGEIWKVNLPDEIRGKVMCRHFRGRSSYRGMSATDRLIMNFATMMVKDQKEKERMKGETDNMSKESALAFVKEIKKDIKE